jgi:nucleoside-diphosphate-sugar epimerase
MNILVTGHKGFVGGAVFRDLKLAGHNVIGFDLPENDILCPPSNITANIDICVHLSAIADLNDSVKEIQNNFSVNVLGTWKMAMNCMLSGTRFLYISTCCVYGNGRSENEQENEDTTLPLPTELYAESKLCGEHAIKCIPGLEWSIYRIGTVYGPNMRKALFNYIAIDKISNDQEIEVHGNGSQTRNYVYVDDVSKAVVKACDDIAFPSFDIINICGNESISVNNTIELVSELLEMDYKNKTIPDRNGQIAREDISNTKSKILLGMDYISYYNGMRKTIEWYKTK